MLGDSLTATLSVAPVTLSALGEPSSSSKLVELTLEREEGNLVLTVSGTVTMRLAVRAEELWQAGPCTWLLRRPGSLSRGEPLIVLEAQDAKAAAGLARLAAAVRGSSSSSGSGNGRRAADSSAASHFDRKTDKGSAELYFHY